MDKTKISFNGVGRTVLDLSKPDYLDNDIKSATITVKAPPPPVPGEPTQMPPQYPPDIILTAPEKANIFEDYTVAISPIIPPGEELKSLILGADFDNEGYTNLDLIDNRTNQNYSRVGLVNYAATIELQNGKSKTVTAVTQIADERVVTAKADLSMPKTTYEGRFETVFNKNKFYFDGITYNAQSAYEEKIGTSIFDIQDQNGSTLRNDFYATQNYNRHSAFDIRYFESGVYNVQIEAIPKNGDIDTDIESIRVFDCPDVVLQIKGFKKDDRKLVLDYSKTIFNPEHPIDHNKTIITIEDVISREIATISNTDHPNTENIKTCAIDTQRQTLDFLIKADTKKTFIATVTVADARGKEDSEQIVFVVEPDLPPISKIKARQEILRNPDLQNKAEIILTSDSYSKDGDFIEVLSWLICIDSNNDGIFNEPYVDASTLEGYEDLSGDKSRIKFFKSGVGLIDVKLNIKEIFGQATIDEFVSPDDRLEANSSQAVEVTNVAPYVSFNLYNLKKVDTLFLVEQGSTEEAELNSSITEFQASLLENNPPINMKADYASYKKPDYSLYWNVDLMDGYSTLYNTFYENVKGIIGDYLVIDMYGNGDVAYPIDRNNIESFNADLDSMMPISFLPQGYAITSIDAYVGGEEERLINKPKDYHMIKLNNNTYTAILDNNLNIYGIVNSSAFNYISNKNEIFNITTSTVSSKTNISINKYNIYLNLISSKTIGLDSYLPLQFKCVIDDYAYFYGVYNTNFTVLRVNVITGAHSVQTYGTIDALGLSDGYGAYIDEENKLLLLYPDGFYFKETINWHIISLDSMQFTRQSALNWRSLKQQATEIIGASHKHVTYYSRAFPVYLNGKVYTFVEWPGDKSGDRSHTIICLDNQMLHAGNPYTSRSDQGIQNIFSRIKNNIYIVPASAYGRGYVCVDSITDTVHINNVFSFTQATFTLNRKKAYRSDDFFVHSLIYYYKTSTNKYRNDGQDLLFFYPITTLHESFSNALEFEGWRDEAAKSIVPIMFESYSVNDAEISEIKSHVEYEDSDFYFIGNSSTRTIGEKFVEGTSGSFINALSVDEGLNGLSNDIISKHANAQPAYSYYFYKNDYVNYAAFYNDYERDPSKLSEWRYNHTPYTDEIIENNNIWLQSPIKSFSKNGVYRVSHRQMDDTGVSSYDKYSNTAEMSIYVLDSTTDPVPTPPPQFEEEYTPIASIETEGALKQNRRVKVILNFSEDNKYSLDIEAIVWTITPVDGMSDDDIKTKNIIGSNISFEALFKRAGKITLTATFKDIRGNIGKAEKEIEITPDLPLSGNIELESTLYRDMSGNATQHVAIEVYSPDDYIATIKHYIIYDSNNDGDFADETANELVEYQDLREFEIEITEGVGRYKLLCIAVEGFVEETIAEFVSQADYNSISLVGTFEVDNLKPAYSIRTDKKIYLTGERIKYISNWGNLELRGDYLKGYMDYENDPMSGLSAKYIQETNFMPTPDSTSIYHDVHMPNLLSTLDKAGRYTIQTLAFDDPKLGDERFAEYRRESSEGINTIIVHRKPEASASFEQVIEEEESTEQIMPTHYRIIDTSFDPDGFDVKTSLSYKLSGEHDTYRAINSGEVITLPPGNIATVLVQTEDNWGATDVRMYSLSAFYQHFDYRIMKHNKRIGAPSQSLILKDIATIYPYSLLQVDFYYVFGDGIEHHITTLYPETDSSKIEESRIDFMDINASIPHFPDSVGSIKMVTTAFGPMGIVQKPTTQRPIKIFSPLWETFEADGTLKFIDSCMDDVPEHITLTDEEFTEINNIRIYTSVYVEKVEVCIGEIRFYINKGGSIELPSTNYESIKYTARNLLVQTNGALYRWTFELGLVSGYLPAGDNHINIIFTAYDEFGASNSNLYIEGRTIPYGHNGKLNSQRKEAGFENVRIYDFKVGSITDHSFKGMFDHKGIEFTAAQLAIDSTNHPARKLMKRGYAFYFEISSRGLSGDGDVIRIRPRFKDSNAGEYLDAYYINEFNKYAKITTDPDGQRDTNDIVKIYYEASMKNLLGYHNEIYIPMSLRETDGTNQHWYGRYGIPATTIFVKKGESPMERKNRIMKPVTVFFDIAGIKDGRHYSYNDNWWEEERLDAHTGEPINPIKYANYDVGDVILIDPRYNISNNYEVITTH